MRDSLTAHGIRFTALVLALVVVLSASGPVGTASATAASTASIEAPVTDDGTAAPKVVTSNETLLDESFETDTLAAAGWTHQATEASSQAGVSEATAHAGSSSAYHYAGAGALVSSDLNASGASSVTVSYWVRKGADSFSENPEGPDEDLVVEYRDSDGTWVELDRIEDSIAPGATVSETMAVSDAAALHDGMALRFRQEGASTKTGDYWHVDDVSVTATYERTVSASSSDPPDQVDVEVAETRVGSDETTTLDVTVSDLDDGLGMYDLSVTLQDGSVADVRDVEYRSSMWNPAPAELSDGNATVLVQAADIGRETEEQQLLGQVEVRGETYGSTQVTAEVRTIEDNNGRPMRIRDVEAGTVSVVPGSVANETTPTDPDDDGRFEDVDGDGAVDRDDVQTLAANLTDPAVQGDQAAYDYNGNGRVDFADVVTLADETARSSSND